MSFQIDDIAIGLPEKILSNSELAARFPGWSAEKISTKLGIDTRHVLADDECPSDLAVTAARRLFEDGSVQRDDIDYLIFCTQAPDYLLPTTACIIQDRLGLPTTIGAIDINQGCSGYVHGLALSAALVEAGLARKVLLLTADAYSKFVSADDASVSTIFGDAATATVVSAAQQAKRKAHFAFGTDGSGADALIVRNSGLRKNGGGDAREPLYMDGPGVLNFTLREIPRFTDSLIARAGIEMEQIDHFILHQANSFILSQLARKMKIPAEKMIIDFADVGNTVSSTIPIALSRQIAQGTIVRGQTLALLGFGVGLSWAGCILEF